MFLCVILIADKPISIDSMWTLLRKSTLCTTGCEIHGKYGRNCGQQSFKVIVILKDVYLYDIIDTPIGKVRRWGIANLYIFF